MTRFRIDWGIAAILAVPLAVGWMPADDFGWSSVAIHVGPFYIAFSWRSE